MWCSGPVQHRRLTGLRRRGLVNTDSCSSQPQPRQTRRVAPDRPAKHARLSGIEGSHKAGKCHCVISGKVLPGDYVFQPPDEPAAPPPLLDRLGGCRTAPVRSLYVGGRQKGAVGVCRSTSGLWSRNVCRRNTIMSLTQPKGKRGGVVTPWEANTADTGSISNQTTLKK